MDNNKGLYGKYNVTKVDTGELVNECFILRPDKDPAAVAALTAYAQATENKQLAYDIMNWIKPDDHVVRLPCKEGTPVFTTRWWDNVEEKCTDSKGKPFYRTRMKHKVTKESFDPFGLDYTEWGKSVFLNKKEAEAALANQ
jgi:hypothetical protein